MQLFPFSYSMKPWLKKALIGLIILVLAAAAGVWYIFTEKFTDTIKRKADYTVNAKDLIREFQKNDSLANKKYAEKIIIVNGIVSEMETADTTVNIKFSDPETGGYIIFAFQQNNIPEAKQLKEGDKASIKGSCSGGAYSEILEAEYITFKRCALNK
jgi:hypothetical protein